MYFLFGVQTRKNEKRAVDERAKASQMWGIVEEAGF